MQEQKSERREDGNKLGMKTNAEANILFFEGKLLPSKN